MCTGITETRGALRCDASLPVPGILCLALQQLHNNSHKAEDGDAGPEEDSEASNSAFQHRTNVAG